MSISEPRGYPAARGFMSPTRLSNEETRFAEMIFPDQANHYGALFAGSALSLLSKAAFVAASRRARGDVVMARSEATDFHTPVRVGELLDMVARVVRVGRTSLTVEVEGVAETLATGARRSALHGRFEMVAVDADGRPTPVDLKLASGV